MQECSSIITSLKHFCQDYSEIPVIVTGSMVRIKLQRISKDNNQFLFPVGKINQLTLYPMTFDEYLVNTNPSLLKAQHLHDHISFPFEENNEGLYRLYLADIGMFTYQSGLDGTEFLSNDSKNTLSRIFFENYFACELAAKNHNLLYWTSKSNAEFEFVTQVSSTAIPMDVKKGKGVLNSLEKFWQCNGYKIAIKISKNNLGYNDQRKILTVPLYDAFLIAEDLKNNKILGLH